MATKKSVPAKKAPRTSVPEVSRQEIQQRIEAEKPRRTPIQSPPVVIVFGDPAAMSPEVRAECARWLRKKADALENFGHEWPQQTQLRFPPEPA